jgi:hypothetical protein
MSGDIITPEISVNQSPVGDAIEVNKVILSDFKGRVCLTFEKQCDCLTLTPQEALTMSEALGRQAYRSRFGDFPHGATKQTIEQLRIRCVARVALMLNKDIADEKDRKVRATALVDEVLKLVR